MKFANKIDSKLKKLINDMASTDPKVSEVAMNNFAQAAVEPVERAIFDGDNSEGIFVEQDATEDGGVVTYPKDLITVGNEDDFVAYKMPNQGGVPERQVSGDEVGVPTYRIANSIDWELMYAKRSRIDVIQRSLFVLGAGFVKKQNKDGWTTILTAAAGKGTMYSDSGASAGQFTKEALSSMKTGATRQGGNATSAWNFNVSDLYLSPEGIEDIRAWTLASDGVDETTMREIFVNGGLATIYGTIIHNYPEFGGNREYQLIYNGISGATSMAANDQEIFIGLDLDPQKREYGFVRPVAENLQIFEDPALHRRGRAGFYAWLVNGTAVLDSRLVYVGSF